MSFSFLTIPQVLNFANHSAQSIAMGIFLNEAFSQYNEAEILEGEPLGFKFYATAAAPCILYGTSVLDRVWRLRKRDDSKTLIANPLALSLSAMAGSMYYWINASFLTCDQCSGRHLTDAELTKQCTVFTMVNLTVATPLGVCLIAVKHRNKAEPHEQIPLNPI